MRSPAIIGQFFLRAAVGLAFLYPPIDALLHPDSWIGYFPNFILNLPIPELLLLHGFGLIEVTIALWIFSGWRIRIPAFIAAAMLIAIVIFNGSQFPILFRDVSIAFAAIALAFIPKPTNV